MSKRLERINALAQMALRLAAIMWHQKSFRKVDVVNDLLSEAKMGAVKSADLELYDFAIECKKYVHKIRETGSKIQENITYNH